MSPIVEKVCDSLTLGEGPHWDSATQSLFYVDIMSATVHRYVPATGQQTTAKVEGDYVSLIVPVLGKKNLFIISQGRQLSLMTWDGESSTPSKVEKLLSVDNHATENRINDGKADPTGRLWAGTMGPELPGGKFTERKGCLFSLDAATKATTTHATEISIANGLAWSADLKHMYYIDSLEFKVEAFDFDAKQGTISNRKTVFDFPANKIEGLPDGMTIDAEGKLWVACFGGAQVLRVDPDTGKLLSRVAIPSLQVTSVAFGGPNLDELYVTSANLRMEAEQKAKFPDAGAVFKVTGLGVRGLEGVAAKL